ncbi:MAG: cobalamin-dependent protein, partial [Candidatus Riflebacteria bacterium]|nr:cobalamin-dependent protein [Candidatus Riflebacteria bacterium]
SQKYRKGNMIMPETEWAGDGTVLIQVFIPEEIEIAKAAALELAAKMGLDTPEIVNAQVMHPSEGTFVEVKGKTSIAIDRTKIKIPPKDELLDEDEIKAAVKKLGLKVVAGTVGEDEHSVGIREILDIKHGGIEKYGVKYHYLGTSVPVAKMVDAAIETGADAILISTIISHNDVHKKNMRLLDEIAREKGIRDKVICVCGGTQVTREIAKEAGMDDGFGRGTKGIHVISSIVKMLKARGKV